MTESVQAREQFADLMALPERMLRLDRAALAIARAEYPALDLKKYLDRLDDLASGVRPRLSPEESPERLIAELNEYLFGEESFRGNEGDYYDPRNSYLNEVLDRRVGIPITLSLLYVEIGRRLGLPLEGVGMPGHFIVRWPSSGGDLLIDPFDHGRLLTIEDCARRVRQMYGDSLRFSPSLLRPGKPREIVGRMLGNLKGCYLRRGDLERALRSVDWGLLVQPSEGHGLRERGLLRYRLGDFRGAIADLENYLESHSSGRLADETRRQLGDIEALWTRRN